MKIIFQESKTLLNEKGFTNEELINISNNKNTPLNVKNNIIPKIVSLNKKEFTNIKNKNIKNELSIFLMIRKELLNNLDLVDLYRKISKDRKKISKSIELNDLNQFKIDNFFLSYFEGNIELISIMLQPNKFGNGNIELVEFFIKDILGNKTLKHLPLKNILNHDLIDDILIKDIQKLKKIEWYK